MQLRVSLPRWLRIALWSIAGAALAALLTLVVSLYLLLQPDRFTALLQREASNAGLVLNLASPASPTLFPRPALELQGLTLSAKGAGMSAIQRIFRFVHATSSFTPGWVRRGRLERPTAKRRRR